MPIMQFSSDEEAVKLANDSKYGLGCAVFSGSQRRAKKIASQIVCGVAAINDFASNYMCQVNFSFRGAKRILLLFFSCRGLLICYCNWLRSHCLGQCSKLRLPRLEMHA